jgi:hypothetical protein
MRFSTAGPAQPEVPGVPRRPKCLRDDPDWDPPPKDSAA